MNEKVVKISLEGRTTTINRGVYKLLFENSQVYSLREYKKTLERGTVGFSEFVKLARKADIPYALFFAPMECVQLNQNRKNKILSEGLSKNVFSMNSRGSVQIRDIDRIVKNILQKQELLKKHDTSLPKNNVLGCLKASRKSIKDQAIELRELLSIDLTVLQNSNKKKAFQYIMSLLENQNVFVSQSSRGFMPQNIQNHVRFSGVCVKDKRIPFIFLNNKDETKSYEPEGRKVLTLTLLSVCLAKSKFSPVSYDEHAKDFIRNDEFSIAEEVLMPREAVKTLKIKSIEDIKKFSAYFCITPSAFLMRLRHLSLIGTKKSVEYANELRHEFNARPNQRSGTPIPINGLKKYNGIRYPLAIFDLVDSGHIQKSEAARVLFQNKFKDLFYDFRENW